REEWLEAGILPPVEAAAVHDGAADRRAVAADPLRGRVEDDVGAVVERTAEKRRRERVVHDERHPRRMGDTRERFEVGHVELRVADRLDIDGAGRVVYRGGDLLP